MPLTPFHMGPALALKPFADRHFSVMVFGVSQVLIDIEPFVGLLRGSAVLHGFSHTLGGATLIALVAVVLGRPSSVWFLRRWTRSSLPEISPTAAWTGAFVGTYSHLVLDGMMHLDMRPFAPFTEANPMLGAMSVIGIYILCVATGVAGWAVMVQRTAAR